MKNTILNLLYKYKAIDIKIIKLDDLYNFTDTIIIATGSSKKHIDSISDNIIKNLKDNKNINFTISGKNTYWIIIDIGEVVIHIMSNYLREYYQIEMLWSESNLNT